MNATGIDIPPTIVEGLNAGKRPKVAITINGWTYRSTVAVMGGGYVVGIPAEQRGKFGISAGDEIEVSLELDTAPREVTAPPDLLAAVDAAGAREQWERLSYTHRKEHVRAIEEAKAPETRQRRIEKAVAMVTARK
jgi:antitoxin component of MazEF toxin-antitoxin module